MNKIRKTFSKQFRNQWNQSPTYMKILENTKSSKSQCQLWKFNIILFCRRHAVTSEPTHKHGLFYSLWCWWITTILCQIYTILKRSIDLLINGLNTKYRIQCWSVKRFKVKRVSTQTHTMASHQQIMSKRSI